MPRNEFTPFTPVTAAEIAQLTNARKAGPDRWMGHCPGSAHRRCDRNSSLSIRQCGDRVLIFCFACGKEATPEIVEALGLSMAALSRPLPPELRAQLRNERIVQLAAEQRQARAERLVTDRCRLLARLEDALFGPLLRAEGVEADALAAEWHATLALSRDANEAWEELHPLRIPKRCSTCLSDRCPHWQAQVARWWPHGERRPQYELSEKWAKYERRAA